MKKKPAVDRGSGQGGRGEQGDDEGLRGQGNYSVYSWNVDTGRYACFKTHTMYNTKHES